MASSEADISTLSAEQQNVLQQYITVTGQDSSEAIPLLQRSQWNTQIAITKFFDGEQPDPVIATLGNQSASSRPLSQQENLQESLLRESFTSRRPNHSLHDLGIAPRIVPQHVDQTAARMPFLLRIIFSPLQIAFGFAAFIFSRLGGLFPTLSRLLSPSNGRTIARRKDTTGRQTLSPRDTMARFKREFEEEYGSHSLPFVDNGYAQALDLAKKDLKFLLVILVSPEHDDTIPFIQEVLLAPEVAAFLNEPNHDIILWAGNILDSEAYQVSTGLKCTKLPTSVLIAHTPERGAATMSVMARIAGHVTPNEYVTQLRTVIDKHKAPLLAERAAREAQHFDRNIRQEQDNAYERSLARDRERVRQRKEAETAAATAEKEAAQRAAAADLHKANLRQWQMWRAANLEEEPTLSEEGSVRIGLKMPGTAQRITRRFRGAADIEEVYAFVECYGIHSSADVVGASPDPPTGFKHEYKFRIVSPIPRQIYSLEDGGSIMERIGKSGNLIVEPVVDEEDDEDVT